ncbi:TetR family transcriptional regulator [Umezawaea sp. NPDC059074]|uniref:TetR family transcriptional regulator n=1 Tax=Umezawaea sp. NPDC059074 TaxID=3346716 RepID=UPI00369ACA9A
MAPRDPEAKKKQLLEAALAEFAEFGIAGARIDRLAKRAGCSAGLVYTYFGGKDELFEAVFDHVVVRAVSTLPIDARDLPGYAGALFDGQVAYPEVMRLAAWHRLESEGRGGIAAIREADLAKVAAIREAQEAGVVSSRFSAEHLLMLVINTASMWSVQTEEIAGLSDDDHARRRGVVVEAVRVLVAP